MGLIGIPHEGSAPCVESPESPDITIGQPIAHISQPSGYAPLTEDMVDIASVRDVEITRTFICKKADVDAVVSWLQSVRSGSVEYNVGSTGKKTISGNFTQSGPIKFNSYSPSLATLKVTYVGTILDCNFTLPPSIRFVKVDARNWNITVDGVVVESYTTATDGDGSGITIAAGSSFYPDLMLTPNPAVNSLPVYVDDPVIAPGGVLTNNGDVLTDGATIARQIYREINIRVNGETSRSVYVPKLTGGVTRKCLIRKLYRGYDLEEVTDTGGAIVGVRTSTPFTIDGMTAQERQFKLATDFELSLNRTVQVPRVYAGDIEHFAPVGATEINTSGSYTAPVAKAINLGPQISATVYPKYWCQIGYAFVRTTAYETVPARQRLTTLSWVETSTSVKLVATGSDGIEYVVMEYQRG